MKLPYNIWNLAEELPLTHSTVLPHLEDEEGDTMKHRPNCYRIPFTEEQTSESVDHTVVSEIIFRTDGERHESHAKTSC